MKLKLVRIHKDKTYTIGKLYVDGVYECDTIEDTVRNLSLEQKVHGKTAIPEGKYKVVIDMSSRFKKMMPHVLNVPYFEGIRIHPGNTSEDTEGCIIVGKNTSKGVVTDSRVCYAKLLLKLKNQSNIEIEIV